MLLLMAEWYQPLIAESGISVSALLFRNPSNGNGINTMDPFCLNTELLFFSQSYCGSIGYPQYNKTYLISIL